MNISPSPGAIPLPKSYKLTRGKGVVIKEGGDIAVFAYGPVMLHEALKASEILESEGIAVEVINMPWLNRVNLVWLEETIRNRYHIFVIEDHARSGGLGEFLISELTTANLLDHNNFTIFSIDGFPACGTPSEALNFHGLDGASLAKRIKTMIYAEQNSI